jgi:hypothetical protein
MTGTALGIFLDVALMLMLGVAIYFGVRLNRQMAVIRSGREEFEKLIAEFGTATKRAESALADLRTEVATSLETARSSSLKAAELCDDLEFLIKRGEKTADSLERGIRAGGDRDMGGRAGTGSGAGGGSVEAGTGRGLAVTEEDRAIPTKAGKGQSATRGTSAKKAKAKSKSELLKALQDMR